MKVELWLTGKNFKEIEPLVSKYELRIKKYIPFQIEILPDSKNTEGSEAERIKKAEAEMVLKKLYPVDYLILLDERGKQQNSIHFSETLQNLMNRGMKRVIFLVGGAYGFHESVYERKNDMRSLSDMTFSHQIIRVMFLEQLFRAFTILNNEPYHHAG